MRRTEILQEVRKMRFQEVYETWQEKHCKSIGKVGKAIGKGGKEVEKGTDLFSAPFYLSLFILFRGSPLFSKLYPSPNLFCNFINKSAVAG